LIVALRLPLEIHSNGTLISHVGLYIVCAILYLQAAIRAKWDAKNNGSLIDALNEEFGAFSKSVKKVFIAQVWI
jgi:hypothetical protein